MTEELYLEELRLEEEARGLTIERFHREHANGSQDDTFSETFLGSYLIRRYLNPYIAGIAEWMNASLSGKVGRRSTASKLLEDVPASVAAFLMLKAIFNKVGVYNNQKVCTLTGLALSGADLIHDEMRLRAFDDEYKKWSQRIHEDFNKRELPREKREEYMRKVFLKAEMPWSTWTTTDKVHVGMALLSIFKEVTGDLIVSTVGTGKAKRDIVIPSEGLQKAVADNAAHCEALFTNYFPMVVPPRDWTAETLELGGYLSHHVTPYPLVKGSRRAYKALLKGLVKEGKLDTVLNAVNALQRTRWQINVPVLDAIEYVYLNNIPCGKLPRANNKKPDPAPKRLEFLPADHPEVKAYRAYCFSIHEHNRRVVGKRVMAGRAFQLARKFSQYDAIYFPHDFDSRGRVYPKPTGLHPQGPDYVKGLLQFADGKPLGTHGRRWLAIHGANCWGEDKLPLEERAAWAERHTDLARSVAADPRADLRWTEADNPCQFLAWCFEWAAMSYMANPEEYVSKLHIDLDATCSGLQHFSAMLRDEVGGFHVNMVPNDKRQDVYGAVAAETIKLVEADLDGDNASLAQAWLKFGISRGVTKRPVMVKPYSGTRQSCGQYVSDAVDEKLEEGHALPWPSEDMWTFKMYGADKVWAAIPKVVVAADGAMKWLCTVSRLVGKSQPKERRIEWTTPLGFPVHQAKFNVKSRQIETFFDGRIIKPRINDELDELDSRQMSSSVPPSFVHSLDACHLQMTIDRAAREGITDFACVHDSFGVHACDVERFSRIIRECFVEMYENHDVLSDFLVSAERLISEEYQKDIPPVPQLGKLDLRGILENPFFFS
ncbi:MULTISPECIES: DNA-directed RNA polymerase [unclassified Aminobacter]|uniref:DNA-directed RNA polymerase n=1 Tax=unclassified Aminobacter TaxID=2644704 RepID=UPI000463D846|nr:MULTISPECIES: DNA-directed RNA polymerase [unclassified Aminobacter]TWH35563.1 DNA-directed RNA polymerase [Aminobacter sp. J15]